MSDNKFAAGETIDITVGLLNKLLCSDDGSIVDGYKIVSAKVINTWERKEGQFRRVVITRENVRKQYSTLFWEAANSWFDPFGIHGTSMTKTDAVMKLYSNKVIRTTDNAVHDVCYR